MSTIEVGGPRVPLDEASHVICGLVDQWYSNPRSVLAMTMARPHIGSYDAFHQANTAVLSIALGGTLGLDRSTLFELGMTALLHQVGVVDMPERIRANRVLDKEERAVLDQLPYRTVRRLLQAHGPDLNAMIRLNTIVALRDPVATKVQGKDGKPAWQRVKPQPPIEARIIAVAARYDALTSEREFREAMAPDKALRLMATRMAPNLDGTLVRMLAELQAIQL
jgi:response regulator RpfG family c-di-GMP phosphodiesterase